MRSKNLNQDLKNNKINNKKSREKTPEENQEKSREKILEKSKGAGILICGAYGLGNSGDEAILTAILRQVREAAPDADITVLSRNPEETAEQRLPRHSPGFEKYGVIYQRRRKFDPRRHQPP